MYCGGRQAPAQGGLVQKQSVVQWAVHSAGGCDDGAVGYIQQSYTHSNTKVKVCKLYNSRSIILCDYNFGPAMLLDNFMSWQNELGRMNYFIIFYLPAAQSPLLFFVVNYHETSLHCFFHMKEKIWKYCCVRIIGSHFSVTAQELFIILHRQ